MNPAPFIAAAYAFSLLASLGLALHSFIAMRASERRVEALRADGRGAGGAALGAQGVDRLESVDEKD